MAEGLTPEGAAAPDPRGGVRGVRRRRAARRTLAVLPTLFTLGNLLCGFAAIFWASRDTDANLPFGWSRLTVAAAFIFLGMVMDALDGRVARLTRNTSDLGEQLDSMADMVTFGVAPAFLAVELVKVGLPFLAEPTVGLLQSEDRGRLLGDRIAFVVACIYVACTALRLARFNIQIEQPAEADHSSFKGLPSPGAAGTVASIVLLHQHLAHAERVRWFSPSPELTTAAMVVIMLLAALAMVSRLRYAHFANRFLKRRAGIGFLGKLVSLLLVFLIFPQGMFALAFTLYALSGPVGWWWRKARGLSTEPPSPATRANETTPSLHEPGS